MAHGIRRLPFFCLIFASILFLSTLSFGAENENSKIKNKRGADDAGAVLLSGGHSSKISASVKKILNEQSETPSTPLHLLNFRGQANPNYTKGKSDYGVDPLDIRMDKLLQKKAGESLSDGGHSSLPSVMSIHAQVKATVKYHGGDQDESVTPTIKHPGLHILDSVTRKIKSEESSKSVERLPGVPKNPSTNEDLSHSIKGLSKVKDLLPPDIDSSSVDFAISTLDIVKNTKVDTSDLSPQVPIKDEIKEKVAGVD
ncbi:MAG: hypothetical protein P8J18_10260, partial [Halieaceae bacterium]|nr:hypothetical protein [Halieaceae bacterium]